MLVAFSLRDCFHIENLSQRSNSFVSPPFVSDSATVLLLFSVLDSVVQLKSEIKKQIC